MKKLALLLVCCCLTMLTSGSEAPSTGAARFIGLWKLVRIEVHQPDGKITPDPDLGPHALGYIYYDSTGHMGVQLMNPDRPKWKSDDQPTSDEAMTTVAGFEAYSGTYDVHPAEGFVVHHTQLSLDPNKVGKDRKRKFELNGDQLRLTPPPFKTVSGVTVEETLIWERVR
jgi:hypothetical protein